MTKLSTNFAGLELKNPLIVSSSSLTNSALKNKKWEDAGAAAVVLKSLFEEEIEAESAEMGEGAHTEEMDYLQFYHRAHRLETYLDLIRETKKVCTIPVIASINCYRSSDWTAFAKSMEEAGADALELNIMSICSELRYRYGSFEQQHLDIVSQVKKAVNIPVIVKLGSHFTNCVPLVHQLYALGASVVLFNRMTSFDINIDTQKVTSRDTLGQQSELPEVLRWTGLVSARVPQISIAASGGVADGASMVKALLAGASAAEVCSALYKNGAEHVHTMLKFVEEWMAKNNYQSIAQLKGTMNAAKTGAIDTFERTQFFKNYSMREE